MSQKPAKPAPRQDAMQKQKEQELIAESGIVAATRGSHTIHCLTVIGTIEGHSFAPDNQKDHQVTSTSSPSWWTLRRTPRSRPCW